MHLSHYFLSLIYLNAVLATDVWRVGYSLFKVSFFRTPLIIDRGLLYGQSGGLKCNTMFLLIHAVCFDYIDVSCNAALVYQTLNVNRQRLYYKRADFI